jgi:hypothetical protein
MSAVILPSSGEQIVGITIWEDKDVYPTVRAGSTDYTNPEAQTVNNNFIAFRNYVNQLRVDLDAVSLSVPDASPTTAGKVTTGDQEFAGNKIFRGGIGIGQQSVTDGFLKLFNATNSFFTRLKALAPSADVDIVFPAKSGTVALLDDAGTDIDASTNLQFARGDVTTLRIRNANGSYVDVTVPVSSFSGKSVVLPAKSGVIVVKAEPLIVPFNVRIDSITKGIQRLTYQGVSLKYVADSGARDTSARVVIKWCLENMAGAGDNVDKFTFDTVPSSSVVGYYIYFPQFSRNLKIASMNGAVATLVSEEGLSTAIGDCHTGALPYVHCNAESYSVVAIPHNPARQDPGVFPVDSSDGSISYLQVYKVNGITVTNAALTLQIGIRYMIRVTAIVAGDQSTAASVPLVNGEWPLIELTAISSEGASVNAEASNAGFIISISGWNDADAYEICYTADGIADFNNVNHSKLLITSKGVEIATGDSRSYSIKVRPIIAGQVVASELEAKVVSGSGGQLPSDQCLITIPVSLNTFSGNITSVGAEGSGGFPTEVASMVTPAGGSTASTFDRTMIGSVLKDSAGREFIIGVVNGSTNCGLHRLIGADGTPPATGAFTINTTKRGRIAYYGELGNIDYDITMAVFDCDVRRDYTVIMRWYQLSQENSYDSLPINATDTEFRKDTDVHVYSSNDVNGRRTFVVDFYDASTSPENRGGVTGTISIFGRPRAKLFSIPRSAL